MAQVVLATVGAAIGGPAGGAIGAMIGGQLDQMALAALSPARQRGPRLTGLHLQGTAEGAPIPAAFGRARLAGTVIWAARFREQRDETGPGKGAPRTVEYGYSLSFAVGLCEGPIDGVGRVWADGKPLALDGVMMRVHRGDEDQAPDALIEATEGAAPAYRGLAYVVFENLPLGPYGNRPPQLSFEVFRRPRGTGGLESMLEGVCLIPGAGEFAYDPAVVLRRESLTRTRAENVNNLEGRPDLIVSLDQLQAQLPSVKRVSLVVSWFGDDLRCGACRIRPGVERATKPTLPSAWRVAGVERGDAYLISSSDDGPAYGGTPSDASVRAALLELKARGYDVTLMPFLMMDVPPGNALPDPHGGAAQAAYPWRGRITCHPAPGQPGSPDRSAAAAAQVSAFFGAAAPADFTLADGEVVYAGPDEWSWRRMVLHYAHVAAGAGADGFVIGSELRGLTTIRDDTGYPAVNALRSLAQDCRAVLGPAVVLTYGADWSEWFGHRPADGSGDVLFHLDPLWADPAISCIGIDWYPPLADWTVDGGLDRAAGWPGPQDPGYLAANMAGGEGYDWFYATPADRLAQTRSPIVDTAHGEDWVFRPKAIAEWWSNVHHDRPAGVRSETPTAWQPMSKPVRLMEFGCAAIDRGANAPNLFLDPKSAESGMPPYSTGARDDLMQRRALEAVLGWFADPAHNPVSPVYGGPMLAAMDAWCWDARPYPDFPARPLVWRDADNWACGHWLNGRMTGQTADLIRELAARGGVDSATLDLSAVRGAVEGYVVDRPMSVADAIAPLLLALDLETAEQGGRIVFIGDAGQATSIGDDDLALVDGRPPERFARELDLAPDHVRARFIDGAADYRTGAVVARRDSDPGGGGLHLDLPLVTNTAAAEAMAGRIARRVEDARDTLTLHISPLTALRLEAGDDLLPPERSGVWRVRRVDHDERPRVSLAPRTPVPQAERDIEWRPGDPPDPAGPPWLTLLDLPPLPGAEADPNPLVAAATDPWRPVDVHARLGEGFVRRASLANAATVGRLVAPLASGELHRWDERSRLVLGLEAGTLASASAAAVLGGANRLAVMSESGEWEVLGFRDASLTAPGVWRLSGLLRGLGGAEAAAMAGAGEGAVAVVLDSAPVRLPMAQAERNLPLTLRAVAQGAAPGGPGAAEIEGLWRGVSLRPWSPAHLRARRRADGGLDLSWTRRSRLHGDGWDVEPPLAEEFERYRVEIRHAGSQVRTWETDTPGSVWTAEARGTDFPGGTPPGVVIRVSQLSAVWGWGEAAEAPAPVG